MKALTFEWWPWETIHEGGEAKDSRAMAWTSAYDGSRKEMVASQNISSSSNERKLRIGDDTLQIKRKKNVKHIAKRIERMHYIDSSGQLTHNQATSWSVSWLENQYRSYEHA